MATKQSLLVLALPISLTLLISLMNATTLAAPPPAAAPPQHFPTPPSTAPTNTPDIENILKQANSFSMFLRLMKTTQLINQLNSQLATIKSGGITLLAPDDGAFSQLKPGFLNSLSDAKKLQLLQFHVLPDFVSTANFDTITNPVRTLAGNKPGKLELNVVSYGGVVNISTGEVNTTVNGVVYSDNHLAIYRVGKVLLPQEFFPPKKIIAPAPAPKSAAEVVEAPAPKPYKEKPLPSSRGNSSESSSSSQVVPVQTSGGLRFGVSSLLVIGLVFVRVANLIV